jgi:O-methyltransferase
MYRAYSLWTLLTQTKALEGDILEVGVWRGGTGCLLAARAKTLGITCTTYLCDTFQGVAKAGSNDSTYRGGEHNDASAEIVGRLVSQLGLLNVEIREGLFPDQTAIGIEQNRFRFCHIDVDVYESARQTLEWVWPRLAPGGVVVFDDYGFINCDGVTQIVNEQSNKGDRITLHNLNGQAVMVKTR